MRYDKLVRDKIPEIINKRGEKCKVHIAGDKEYWEKLKEKLFEEIKEFNEEETMGEMADILEIIDAMCRHKKFNLKKLETVKKQKARERGGFKKKIILEES